MAAGCARRVRLRPDVYRATGADGQVTLVCGTTRGERIGALSPGQDATLRALAAGELYAAELDALAGDGGTLRRRLRAGGWLTETYALDGRRLVTVRPLGPRRRASPALVSPVLSRFALLRREGAGLVLESPVSPATVEIHDPAVLAVVHGVCGLPEPACAEIVTVLARHGFLVEAGSVEAGDLAAAQWSPYELWFHARSRGGYHDQPLGATGWADGRFPPPPPRRPSWPGPTVPLPAGNPLDRPFGDVLAARRSARSPAGDGVLTLARLGEFLHWTARVRPPVAGDGPDVSRRPSPSGGARHALEIYPVVTAVDGLDAGLYHYDPYDHLLEPVPAGEAVARELARRAGAAAGGVAAPQVLLVLAARFGRTMWKYQGIGYALILKDAGALMQTMYLVATAMGLSPCALGSGDVELFAHATGLDLLAESSVGEFMLSAG